METLIEFSARASAYPEVFTSIPEKAERFMVLVEPRRYDLMEHVLRWALLQTILAGPSRKPRAAMCSYKKLPHHHCLCKPPIIAAPPCACV